jgi:hypothetical protein
LDEVTPLLWGRKEVILLLEQVEEKGRWGSRIEEEETCVGLEGKYQIRRAGLG